MSDGFSHAVFGMCRANAEWYAYLIQFQMIAKSLSIALPG
jgi:hypothetical protein